MTRILIVFALALGVSAYAGDIPTARGRGGASSGPSYSASQAATDTGWYSDGGSTATTLRAAVGAGGISTDGGVRVESSLGVRALGGNGACLYCTTSTSTTGIVGVSTTDAMALYAGGLNAIAIANTGSTTFGYLATFNSGLSVGTTATFTAGPLVVGSTDSSGSPGAATINKPSGRSAIALGAASVTVTNSQATAASRIFISPLGRDATCLLPVVTTRSAGSFVVSTNGAVCTADLSFDWLVIQ